MEIPLESTIDIIPTVEEVETIVHPEVLPMDDTTNDSIPNFETDSIPSLPEEMMIPSLPQEIQMEDLTQDIIPPIEEVPSEPSEEMEPISSPNYTPFIEEVPSEPSEEMETPLLDWSPDNTPTIEEV
jgi:hypothetical protein